MIVFLYIDGEQIQAETPNELYDYINSNNDVWVDLPEESFHIDHIIEYRTNRDLVNDLYNEYSIEVDSFDFLSLVD